LRVQVVDGVLGREWAMAVREEVRWLGQKRLLTRNRTQFLLADGRVVRFAKPFIEEADLHDDAVGGISLSKVAIGIRSRHDQAKGL
jgi:hypothetical protein